MTTPKFWPTRYTTYSDYGVPFIYAGNQDIRAQIERTIGDNGVDCRISPNVMPEINDFRIEVVNEHIRELFQTVIIRGKGFDVVEEYMDAPFIPTPRACFRGVQLLAHGCGDEEGIGNGLAWFASKDVNSAIKRGPANFAFLESEMVHVAVALPGLSCRSMRNFT
ncbi:MAG: glutamate mutase L [Chloroflexota bacterium]|nr:glutamate mutase L [Chloroflexota bacterium]